MNGDWLKKAESIPGQLTLNEMRKIHEIAAMIPKDGVIVEVGSLYGKSSYTWASGADPSVSIYCFDPWERAQWIVDWVEKPLQAPEFGIEAFKLFTGGYRNILPVKGYSPDSARGWQRPIDLFFDDAVHEGEIFKQNCDFWLSHLKPGGYFCGHDFRPDYHDIVRRVIETAVSWDVEFSVVGSFFWMRKPV